MNGALDLQTLKEGIDHGNRACTTAPADISA
jgi:hypothetical protein